MRWSARHAEARERLQDHVPERVLAAARLRPRPTSSDDQAPSLLPAEGVWLAVSTTHLYAFAARGEGVGDLIEVWDRDVTTVSRAGRLAATRVALRFGTNGHPVELDAPRGRAGRRAFFRYLLDPERSA
ncbi:MAG TPA: hypothetical protein VI462_12460 [Acidimicrobiia bacterium]